MEESLEAAAGLEAKHAEEPDHAQGHRHRFYWLKSASPFHFVDFWLCRSEGVELFLHPVRQGVLPLFDREGILQSRTGDDGRLRAEFAAKITASEAKFWTFGRLMVEKSIRRGHFADAVFQYHQRILYPLIEAVRAVHAPLRQDFGPRYLAQDLPDEVRAQIEELFAVKDAGRILVLLDRAEELFAHYGGIRREGAPRAVDEKDGGP